MKKNIRQLFRKIALISLCAVAAGAHAAPTDLATSPLVSSSPLQVKPNLFLMIDDSGSMGWDYMPDEAGNFSSAYGYYSNQCNGVYYDPNTIYYPPVDYTGASYPNASFTGAWNDGYNTGAGTTNLSTSFSTQAGGTAASAYYYAYTGTQTTEAQHTYYNTASTFYKECNSQIGSAPGNGVFTKVTVSATSGPGGTDERTNFANWYSYYSTRINMMKTATGLAFKPLGTNYRVGFGTMNNNGGSMFINLDTFDMGSPPSPSSQRALWYQKLYSTTANNSTPLLGALAKVGLMYAHKLPSNSFNGVAANDPIQYSCQQNFTILSTDGFWNSQSGNVQLDNATPVGEQDGTETRPMYDGATTTTQTTATITVSGNSKSSVSSITVNGVQILSGTTSGSSTASTVASRIASGINACTNTASGACGAATGYSASATGSVVTITAPASLGAITFTPVVTAASGNMTFATTAFSPTTVATGGTSNTLADVAEYYYITDLRTSALGNNLSAAPGFVGTDVSANNVPSTGLDGASWQHMTLFTLGLGARGSMVFSPTYASDKSGDFFSVKNGVLANPTSGVCSWQAAGTTCNWPVPVSNTQTTIDDLWHAAIDGRGAYFSATSPAMLSMGLKNALAGVTARTGTAAAATTSNPNITSGDNFVFSSTFVTVDWYGELIRQQINLTTGATLSTIDWSAQAILDAKPAATRTIYGFSPTAANGLQLFNNANYGANPWFNSPYINALSQFCAAGPTCLTAGQQGAAQGANLIKFIAGDRGNEGFPTTTTAFYRARKHVLGDIVNAEAAYVKASLHNYFDLGYSAFAASNTTRQGMVYAAANDGMLHAFYAANGTAGITGGDEAWAYIPTMVMPNLYKLADINYSSNHQYFVDGTPVQADVCVSACNTFSAVWKTILVGGLNGGGRGYYAMDITDPANPKALWEFTTANTPNIGYTYGNPEIAKLGNGTWVVMFTSGYNNVAPGDGMGHLYVLNAYTGTLMLDIGTGAGSTSSPSGLSRIIAQVASPATDATVMQVYGGDLMGNLWRFDVNGTLNGGTPVAQLLAKLSGPTGLAQPITTKPQVGIINGSVVVYVGTGRYLGVTDLTNTDPQSFYAIKDPLAANTIPSVAIYPNPRTYTPNPFVQQTQTTTTCPTGAPLNICLAGQIIRTSSNNPVNWAVNSGWYMDLPDSGERSNTDPTLQLGTLGFTTNVPSTSSCVVGGYSYSYFLDYRTGGAVSTTINGVLTSGISAVRLGNALATRPVFVRLPNNTVVQLIRLSDGTTMTPPVPIGRGASTTRRTSWRELITQ